MSNGVMAALQILVLSVQVRVLVGQQKARTTHCAGLFLSVPPGLSVPMWKNAETDAGVT